ncbi:hypothetical protein NDU88_010086, partial [Pleurodeles waltl]
TCRLSSGPSPPWEESQLSPHSPRDPWVRLGWLESSPSPAGHWPASGASQGGGLAVLW